MPNPSLTPLQFLQKYQNLRVNYFPPDGGPVRQFTGIKLRQYYINAKAPKIEDLEKRIAENKLDGLTKEERRENKKLEAKIEHAKQTEQMQSLVNKLKKGRAVDVRFTLQEVRYGKGLPEDYELFLGLAAAAGLCNVGSGPPTTQSIQKFLDDSKMGIDCSGFVSAYFAARGDLAESTKKNVTRIGAAGWGRRSSDERITRISDIRMGDCLVAVKRNGKLLESPGHVMLAAGRGREDNQSTMEFKPLDVKSGKGGDYAGAFRGALYICESRGGGLKHGPAVFKEDYPSKRRPYFMIRRHGLATWLPCIVVRPNFKTGA